MKKKTLDVEVVGRTGDPENDDINNWIFTIAILLVVAALFYGGK